ncbi:uncharacterized protein EV420DRAFT_1638409 [Desarmillaria tabescens]|uniref:HNH nuclease domain-containing protein n=1 Tax=Armillaria tabescens TaxID=1929756 RepID=A0AA39ND90_ARMTA|nr:uncharacterized protein EV420DRAFT_1638409 [Desarmillaria tabescens]KAK0463475.1 hypothetical protein EV420DRAFT_1638409 [Desarmillaria tabescens]
MAFFLVPRPYYEETTDLWEPVYIKHPIHDCSFLILGRRQQVIEDGTERLGILHWFVLDACLVIAGRGFLSSTPDRSGKISTEENGLLTGCKYWYFLDDHDDDDHDICTDFSEWTPLPREEVPERRLVIDQNKKSIPNPPQEESFSAIGSCITQEDRLCILSGVNEELRAVHLVPQAYATWYHSHLVFQQYTFESPLTAPKARPIDDICQIDTLESGLQKVMNRPSFVFAPFGTQYTAFFFAARNVSLVERYHMRSVRLPERIEGYALFARFAWAMTTIAYALPPYMVPGNRKRKRSDASNQSGPSRQRRTEGYDSTAGDDGTESSSEDDSDVHNSSDDNDFSENTRSSDDGLGHLDPESVLNFLKERELELTDRQVQQFRDAEDGTKPLPAFIYDVLNYYPGSSRAEELRRYIAEHPTVWAIGEPTTKRHYEPMIGCWVTKPRSPRM